LKKLKEILEHIQKKFFKKKETTEEEIGNYSMNEGKADKVFGFRREIVKGVAVFFVTVFVLALIFASSDDEETKKEAATLPTVTESEIAEVKKPKNALPNDYETLMAMNKEKELELKRQAAENAKTIANQETVAETPPQMPVIPQGQYKVLPAATQIPKLPEETSENIVAIDGAGYSGIAGKIHHHTGQKISAGAIGSAIAAQGATANLISMTSSMFRESADVENTVTIEP